MDDFDYLLTIIQGAMQYNERAVPLKHSLALAACISTSPQLAHIAWPSSPVNLTHDDQT